MTSRRTSHKGFKQLLGQEGYQTAEGSYKKVYHCIRKDTDPICNFQLDKTTTSLWPSLGSRDGVVMHMYRGHAWDLNVAINTVYGVKGTRSTSTTLPYDFPFKEVDNIYDLNCNSEIDLSNSNSPDFKRLIKVTVNRNQFQISLELLKRQVDLFRSTQTKAKGYGELRLYVSFRPEMKESTITIEDVMNEIASENLTQEVRWAEVKLLYTSGLPAQHPTCSDANVPSLPEIPGTALLFQGSKKLTDRQTGIATNLMQEFQQNQGVHQNKQSEESTMEEAEGSGLGLDNIVRNVRETAPNVIAEDANEVESRPLHSLSEISDESDRNKVLEAMYTSTPSKPSTVEKAIQGFLNNSEEILPGTKVAELLNSIIQRPMEEENKKQLQELVDNLILERNLPKSDRAQRATKEIDDQLPVFYDYLKRKALENVEKYQEVAGDIRMEKEKVDVEKATLNSELLKLGSEEKIFKDVMDVLSKEINNLQNTGDLIGHTEAAFLHDRNSMYRKQCEVVSLCAKNEVRKVPDQSEWDRLAPKGHSDRSIPRSLEEVKNRVQRHTDLLFDQTGKLCNSAARVLSTVANLGGTSMVESALQTECSFLFKMDSSTKRKRKSGNAAELESMEKNMESILHYIREEKNIAKGEERAEKRRKENLQEARESHLQEQVLGGSSSELCRNLEKEGQGAFSLMGTLPDVSRVPCTPSEFLQQRGTGQESQVEILPVHSVRNPAVSEVNLLETPTGVHPTKESTIDLVDSKKKTDVPGETPASGPGLEIFGDSPLEERDYLTTLQDVNSCLELVDEALIKGATRVEMVVSLRRNTSTLSLKSLNVGDRDSDRDSDSDSEEEPHHRENLLPNTRLSDLLPLFYQAGYFQGMFSGLEWANDALVDFIPLLAKSTIGRFYLPVTATGVLFRECALNEKTPLQPEQLRKVKKTFSNSALRINDASAYRLFNRLPEDVVVVPVNYESHWVLIVGRPADGVYRYLTTMGCGVDFKKIINILHTFLTSHGEKLPSPMNTRVTRNSNSKLSIEEPQVVQQADCKVCGLAVMKMAVEVLENNTLEEDSLLPKCIKVKPNGLEIGKALLARLFENMVIKLYRVGK